MSFATKKCVAYAGLILTSGEAEVMCAHLVELDSAVGVFSAGLDRISTRHGGLETTMRIPGQSPEFATLSQSPSLTPCSGLQLPNAV